MKTFNAVLFLLLVGFIIICSTKMCNGQNTLSITMVYEDTSCIFEGEDVQTLYNSGCLFREEGFIVYHTYFPKEFLYTSRKRLPSRYIVWYYVIK